MAEVPCLSKQSHNALWFRRGFQRSQNLNTNCRESLRGISTSLPAISDAWKSQKCLFVVYWENVPFKTTVAPTSRNTINIGRERNLSESPYGPLNTAVATQAKQRLYACTFVGFWTVMVPSSPPSLLTDFCGLLGPKCGDHVRNSIDFLPMCLVPIIYWKTPVSWHFCFSKLHILLLYSGR